MARSILALLSIFCALTAFGADARKYAVLSLIGDEMLVVGASAVTGQRLDRNSRSYVPLDDPLDNFALGTGTVEGVGFYVDPVTEVLVREKQQNATGFVAAFAYFDVALVDLSKGAIVAEQRVVASRTMPALLKESN